MRLLSFILSLSFIYPALAEPITFTGDLTRPLAPPLQNTNGIGAPWDMALNPAALCSPTDSLAGGFLAFGPSTEDGRSRPFGGGFYATTRACGSQVLGLPLPAIGLGITSVSPSPNAAGAPGDSTRATLALAYELGNIQLGYAYHRYFGKTVLSGVDSMDIGIRIPLGNAFSIAGVVRDFNAPQINGQSQQRTYAGDLLIRPFSDARLLLSVGGHLGERNDNYQAHAMTKIRIGRGISVHARAEYEKRLGLDSLGQPDSDNVWRFAAGITIAPGLGRLHYSLATRLSQRDNLDVSGMFVAAEFGRFPKVLPRRTYIERVDVKGQSLDSLISMLKQLRAAARDPKAAAVVITISSIPQGRSGAYALRNAIKTLRGEGKRVIVHVEGADFETMWAAAAADKILVDPAGYVDISGIGSTVIYMKEAFEKVGIEAQFERIAEYKSAPESLLRKGPSKPDVYQRNKMLDDVFSTMMSSIATDRNLPQKTVKQLIDEGLIPVKMLVERGMVDGVLRKEQLERTISKELGGIGYGADPMTRDHVWVPRKISVIDISGDIVSGNSRTVPFLGMRSAGSKTIVAAIDAARTDRMSVGIVVYVNSPGGGVFASEEMARAVAKAAKVTPPVCVMGDVAASGGYYVSAPCQRIFASPTTVTGSIGIFSGKIAVAGLLSNLGINWKTYKRGEHARINSQLRKYSASERKVIRRMIRSYYEQFLRVVAQGRNMTPEQVNKLARGRIYSGGRALAVGLVDEMGGLSEALEYVSIKSGFKLHKLRIEQLPQQRRSLLQQLGVGIQAKDDATSELTRRFLGWLPASLLLEPNGAWARLPWVETPE